MLPCVVMCCVRLSCCVASCSVLDYHFALPCVVLEYHAALRCVVLDYHVALRCVVLDYHVALRCVMSGPWRSCLSDIFIDILNMDWPGQESLRLCLDPPIQGRRD